MCPLTPFDMRSLTVWRIRGKVIRTAVYVHVYQCSCEQSLRVDQDQFQVVSSSVVHVFFSLVTACVFPLFSARQCAPCMLSLVYSGFGNQQQCTIVVSSTTLCVGGATLNYARSLYKFVWMSAETVKLVSPKPKFTLRVKHTYMVLQSCQKNSCVAANSVPQILCRTTVPPKV